MTNLTAKELKIFNNLSRVQSPNVSLGNRIQELISGGGGAIEGSPVNAVAASGILSISGVVIDGETVIINNPLVVGSDVYEFLADVLLTKSVPANKVVNINAYVGKAVGVLTVDTQPTVDDTMTIGTKLYTFVTAGTEEVDGDISVGATLAAAKLNIVAAINGTDAINTAHPLVTAAAFEADTCTITALVGGTLGNAIVTTETFFTGTNIFAAGVLGTGTDCSAANAVTALAAAITALDTQGVGGVDGAGNTVDITANIAGDAGNDITTTVGMVNGSFADAKLTGGIDGTVGLAGSTMIDETYQYVAIAENTIADANWRRIAVGVVY